MKYASILIPLVFLVLHSNIDASSALPKVEKNQLNTLPLYFTPNMGQFPNEIKFCERSQNRELLFLPQEVIFNLSSDQKNTNSENQKVTLRLKWLHGSKLPEISGEKPQTARVNFIKGNNPKNWKTGIPTFGTVAYHNVYPGIDLKFYGKTNQLEYDLLVHPGANPGQIALSLGGIVNYERQRSGDLILQLNTGQIFHYKPKAYQENNGKKTPIASNLVVSHFHPKNQELKLSFQIAQYDRSRTLIIDPVMIYSTYFGGTDYEYGSDIAVDTSGIYIIGQTFSTGLATPGAYDTTCGTDGNCNFDGTNLYPDAYVTKLNSTGTALLFSTYLGGSKGEDGSAIKADSTGVYVAGATNSDDFPTTVGAYDSTCGTASGCNGAVDGFIAKLAPDGASLIYSTFLGGSDTDQIEALAIDSSGAAYVTGLTGSVDFPTTAGAFDRTCGTDGNCDVIFVDSFVTKLTNDGTNLVYSTYLGGERTEWAFGIAVDSSDQAHVTGYTVSSNFPVTPNAFDSTCGTDGNCNLSNLYKEDAFLSKLNAAGSDLLFSTYLGGSDVDIGLNIVLKTDITLGNETAVIIGRTSSDDFPVKDAIQPIKGGMSDIFLTRFSLDGRTLLHSTFLGGDLDEFGTAIATNPVGHIFIGGSTSSSNFPTVDPFQPNSGGLDDAVVAKVHRSGCVLLYSSYLGGTGRDSVANLAVDFNENVFLTGQTLSSDFPVMNPLQNYSGSSDAFISEISHTTVGPLYYNDFSDGVLDWNVVNGIWSESNDTLIGTSNPKGLAFVSTPWTPSGISGCTVVALQFDIQVSVGSKAILEGWFQDNGNKVELVMKEDRDTWILKQKSNKALVRKSKFKRLIDPGTNYHVLLQFDGVTFTLLVDGTPLITMRAAAIPSGKFGLKIKNGTATIETFQIY